MGTGKDGRGQKAGVEWGGGGDTQTLVSCAGRILLLYFKTIAKCSLAPGFTPAS